jgi:hypothetical protein
MGRNGKDCWRELFSRNVERVLGSTASTSIVPPFDPENEYTVEENIEWTKQAMRRLMNVEADLRLDILNSCSHQISDEYLQDLKEVWNRNQDLEELHSYWKERFIDNLDIWPGHLSREQIDFIEENEWGEAGRLEGNTIIATKIPCRTREYFESQDPVEKRHLYCHCPRIRPAIKRGGDETLSCFSNCGGGFYRSNWEGITGESVKVEMMNSVLRGDDVCSFRISIGNISKKE